MQEREIQEVKTLDNISEKDFFMVPYTEPLELYEDSYESISSKKPDCFEEIFFV